MPTEPPVRDEIGNVVLATLRPISLGFGLFILYTSIRGYLTLPDAERLVVATTDLLVGAYLLGLAAWLYFRPPPLRWMNPLGATVALSLAGTDMTTMSVRGMVPDFPAVVLVLAGFGAVVLSWRWMLGTTAVIIAAWLTVTNLFAANPGNSAFLVQIAAIAGLAIHWGRLRAYTRLIAARDAQAEARAEAEKANEELERFASVVAHDLKTPVAAVQMKAHLLRLRTPAADRKAHKTIDEIDHVAQGMGAMIDRLLEYARAGQKSDHREIVDMDVVIDLVRQILATIIVRSGAELRAERLPSVYADPTLIIQLVQNLVANAIAYGKPGVKPVVTVSVEQAPGGHEIIVQDNGPGIDLDDLERLMLPFERGAHDTQGHGLGLATCRRIVEAHQGRLQVESPPGEGARFRIWLPAAPGVVRPPRPKRAKRREAGPPTPP